MKFNKRTLRSLLILSTLTALAAMSAVPHTAFAARTPNKWFFAVNGGFLLPSQDKGGVLVASSDPLDPHMIVMSPEKVKTNYAINLSIGRQFNWERNFFPGMRASLTFSQQGTQKYSGVIFDAVNPNLFTTNYSYQVNSQVILLDQAFELISWNNFTPYLHTGVGMAMNSVSNYQATTSGSVQPTFNFNNKNSNGLAYVLGVGVDYKIKKNLSIGISYDRLSQGTVQLAPAATAAGTSVTAPKNNLNNQIILLGVRYEFAK